ALAKKKGTNAVDVADNVLANLEKLRPLLIPDDVYVEVTRNYGETARKKVDGLLASLGFAILTVVAVLAFTLGWKASLVVAVSIPVSFSLALFCSYLMGFTINRVTLFALILSLGLVVDDPITNVDNIKRHMRMKYPSPEYATLAGVAEVFPPVLMSTLAIIACFLPLFFITGMMGPYMAPMAANVPLTVIFSTISALTVVPWMCRKLMGNNVSSGQDYSDDSGVPQWIIRFYSALVRPFLNYGLMRMFLLGLLFVLLSAALLLAVFGMVPLKMLPFDNKDEFQIVIDMPRGTTLETTDRVVRDFEGYLEDIPEVTSFVSYTGQASPMDFNGMVRQYYLRGAPEEAEIRVNLKPAEHRKEQSHALVLAMRRDLEAIAEKHGAALKIVEMPPGPPVMSTIVAEIYAEPDKTYQEMIQASKKIRGVMEDEEFVRDVDDSVKEDSPRITFVLDREKADIHGIRASRVIDTLALAVQGARPAALHNPWERRTVPVKVVVPEKKRSNLQELENIRIRTSTNELVLLGELGEFQVEDADQPVLHKNLKRVVYVTAETVGQPPAEAILDMQSTLERDPLPPGFEVNWRGEGEWKITLDVCRDLGIAFGAALLGIYLLLIIQTGSLSMPLLIMSAIPLTLTGIMPGFYLLNLLTAGQAGGFEDPVFFTATAMIGMIALGGIVIRNSLVLLEFISSRTKSGQPLKEAVLQSGAIRLRPIVLTAMTTALGVWPITLDPIFSGLAWTLIFGLVASTLFTLVLVPVVYYMIYR
ncbi:MAG: efflux RND transporter permease subunit, partial [Desulfonatronovibrionaceae bacterium]